MGSARVQLDAASAIEQAVFSYNVRVYPNPVSDFLIIEKSGPDTEYSIFGINGALVLSGSLTDGSSKINMGGLADGIYYLRVGFWGEAFRVMVVR
jgi:hypothetical protein